MQLRASPGLILVGTSEGEWLQREEAYLVGHPSRMDSTSRFHGSKEINVAEHPYRKYSARGPIDQHAFTECVESLARMNPDICLNE